MILFNIGDPVVIDQGFYKGKEGKIIYAFPETPHENSYIVSIEDDTFCVPCLESELIMTDLIQDEEQESETCLKEICKLLDILNRKIELIEQQLKSEIEHIKREITK